MPSATVRIRETTRRTLRELAERTGQPMQAVLEKAIDQYRRQRFLEEVNRAFDALRRDPEAWKAVLRERAAWDATLADGLEPDDKWAESGKAIRKGKARKGRD